MTARTISPGIDTTGTGTGPQVTDLFAGMKACDMDDYLSFKNNSKGEYNEGASKCDQADPQTEDFIWTLEYSNTMLNINGIDYTILQLDNSTLKFSMLQISVPFDPFAEIYTITDTYRRK